MASPSSFNLCAIAEYGWTRVDVVEVAWPRQTPLVECGWSGVLCVYSLHSLSMVCTVDIELKHT